MESVLSERHEVSAFYGVLKDSLQPPDIALTFERGQITMVFEHDAVRADIVVLIIQPRNLHSPASGDLVPLLEPFGQKDVDIPAFALQRGRIITGQSDPFEQDQPTARSGTKGRKTGCFPHLSLRTRDDPLRPVRPLQPQSPVRQQIRRQPPDALPRHGQHTLLRRLPIYPAPLRIGQRLIKSRVPRIYRRGKQSQQRPVGRIYRHRKSWIAPGNGNSVNRLILTDNFAPRIIFISQLFHTVGDLFTVSVSKNGQFLRSAPITGFYDRSSPDYNPHRTPESERRRT